MPLSLYTAHQHLESTHWAGLPIAASLWLLADALKRGSWVQGLWVIVPTEEDIESTVQQLQFWLDSALEVHIYPADEEDTFSGLSPMSKVVRQRIITSRAWYTQRCVVVSSVFGRLHPMLSETVLEQAVVEIAINDTHDPSALAEQLQGIGYQLTAMPEQPGELLLRGDTMIVWPNGARAPARISFFDDEVDGIELKQEEQWVYKAGLTLLPARELFTGEAQLKTLSRSLHGYVRSQGGTGRELRRRILSNLSSGLWLPGVEDYLPYTTELTDIKGATAALNSPRCHAKLAEWGQRLPRRWSSRQDQVLISPQDRYTDIDALHEQLSHAWHFDPRQEMDDEVSDSAVLRCTPTESLICSAADISPLLRRLRRWLNDGWTILLCAGSDNRLRRFAARITQELETEVEVITSVNQLSAGTLQMIQAPIADGWVDPASELAVLSMDYLLKLPRYSAPRRSTQLRDSIISSHTDLQVNDYIVHRDYGIGQFIGISQVERSGLIFDCIELRYADNAKVFLNVTKLNGLYRYRSNKKNPKLDKIGHSSWAKRLSKAREKAFLLADRLIEQLAIRGAQPGRVYSGYPQLLTNVSADFPFEETPDQAAAIDEVLQDLALDRPMNRLIIGDVGFGKTEVAIRAAARVVAEGCQVALLCPTTILALQHYRTFAERFAHHGVIVAMLSRLQSASEKRKIFRAIQKGEVDIVIGTHALFGKDLRFEKLGLVIADEEHRFGVAQKEKLKSLSQLNPEFPAEYLAMSATPIPRTLHMALSGLREVSVIATPPPGRKGIQTRCYYRESEQVELAIRAELSRGGQVFVIHNRISSLEQRADELRSQFPSAVIRTASGKMNRKELEQTLIEFINRQLQVLVCTTIIENGIDMPNANTMIVDHATQLGLAQLYQLRGRVGRGRQQGHCILMLPSGKLERDVMSRINALREHSNLGAGFAIASADLEIRGGGNLLGKDQSGHIESVGLDTYIDLLNEAIRARKPHLNELSFVPELNLPISAVIPVDFLPEAEERIRIYSQLAAAQTLDDLNLLSDSLEQQYGSLPISVLAVMQQAELRVWCQMLGIERVDWLKTRARLIAHPSTKLHWRSLQELAHREPKNYELAQFGDQVWTLFASFSPQQREQPLDFLQWLFARLLSLIK